MTIQFTIPGLPRPKERARKGRHGNFYTPRATEAYEYEVWVMAQKAGARQLMFESRPVWIGLQCFFSKPVLRSKRRADPGPFPTGKPDMDNVLKCVIDGMRPAFKDDAQVIGFLNGSGKFWGDPQRTEVEITDSSPRIYWPSCEHGFGADCLQCATDRLTLKADL